jgi:hypothetical protein
LFLGVRVSARSFVVKRDRRPAIVLLVEKMSAPLWTFSDEIVTERRAALAAVPNFSSIVDRIAGASIESFWAEPREAAPCLGTHRAIFDLLLERADYDAFFNSPVGYRAQYCIEIENGKAQNRRVLDALRPRLLDFAERSRTGGFGKQRLSASLDAVDAKVWINEAEVAKVEGIHILYEPWLAKLQSADVGSATERNSRESAEIGLRAPAGQRLEVKGGWVTLAGVECRDPAKARRAEDIRDYGHS